MRVKAVITTRWSNAGYVPIETDQVEAYSIDSAMDTDTDSWNLSIGDPDTDLIDVLKRDNEVRVNIFGLGNGSVETLHTGFTDEITMDETGLLTFTGRDISSVAVDSQHPPQQWKSIRPEVLIAREARALKIGDLLRLTAARGFKSYATDGSESFWQVWYRFYRKRRMWMWAEPDGSLNAAGLNYNQAISYYLGAAIGTKGSGNPTPDQWIPVERAEIRSNKQQRIGEVFYFGHRGDVGFVARAKDPSTISWVKKPNVIVTSSDVHNAAEARVEAWEEIFESKVGAVEIKLTIADPDVIIRQNKMAMVNIPQIGLKGEFFVVGTNMVGSSDSGSGQVVRLREKNYAISRRKPTDPTLKGDVSNKTAGGIASNLSVDAPQIWKQWFVEAAQQYRGPWGLELFLGALLSMCEQESGFQNKRQGGSIIYPGTKDGHIPSVVTENALFNKFAATFANDPPAGRVSKQFGVGPMQLTDRGYKLAADRLDPDAQFDDELAGGRWNPHWNINVSAAVFSSKLGAGYSVTAEGKIVKTGVTGLSLSPIEANLWEGVRAYNGSGPDAERYKKEVKDRYTNTYKTAVESAVTQSRADAKNQSITMPGGTAAELRKQILSNTQITFTRASQRDDVRFGLIHNEVLIFLLAFVNSGYPAVITALKSDHNKYTSDGGISAHGYGLAVDVGNYNLTNRNTESAMEWIGRYQLQLGFSQLIGPVDNLVINDGARGAAAAAFYGAKTLREHDSHIHVGWPLLLAK